MTTTTTTDEVMTMSAPQVMAALTLGWLGYRLFSPKKRKKPSTAVDDADLPSLDCGLYPWKPLEVDSALDLAIVRGERNLERLALRAARDVYRETPEGTPQPWPPLDSDTRAHCILDRIRIRANLRLAELADDDADDEGPGGSDPDGPLPTAPPPPGSDEPTTPSPVPPGPKGPGLKPPSRPDEPTFGGGDDDDPNDSVDPEDPEDPGDWPEYPPPGPVDLTKWTDPANYPTPGKFHQIGGPNSGTTLKAIAIKALTTAFYIIHGDLAVAQELAEREENWRAYREAINCCPWNHALYGSANQPGTPYYYKTPHDDHISLYPVHDDVVWRLVDGQVPRRRVSQDDPKVPSGGRHAFPWLPPLDAAELLEGRVKVEHAHWWTGDFRMMPPPEVLTLGLTNIPAGRVWGCGGYQTSYDLEEDE
jgi:hypothetical protein